MNVREGRPGRLAAAVHAILACLVTLVGIACGESGGAGVAPRPTLAISAIPDQDPQTLASRERALAAYLSTELGIDVEFVPVVDYAASVALFAAGDLDVVFYGGLTGVQARRRVPDARVLAQRDIDAAFRSVFIAHADAGIGPVRRVDGLRALRGRRFTFGSQSSTSGRLMPQFFLEEAGVGPDDFVGLPGFSGSHDKTIDLVAAGSFDAGALSAQVWDARRAAGSVDPSQVVEVFRTPPYNDYHWLARPDLDARFGHGVGDRLREALLGLDAAGPEQASLLAAYGARRIVPAHAADYARIEEIGRRIGLVV